MKKFKIEPIWFFAVIILYLEIITKVIFTGHLFNSGLAYLLFFSLPFVLLFTYLSKAFNKVVNKIIMTLLVTVLVVYFEVQYIFFILFSVPFSFSTISLADQAFDFTSVIRETIFAHFGIFIALLLPLILFFIFIKKINTNRWIRPIRGTIVTMFFLSYFLTFALLVPLEDGETSAKKLYFNIDDQISMIDRFGVLTYTKIDVKRQLFGYKTEVIIENLEPPQTTEEEEEKIKDYGVNQLDIDFDSKESSNSNINTINNFVRNTNPTNRHEYTGMFEGKNLIFILAEGFNEVAVDPERTPTLYKMIHTGFDFTNFYSPVFLSTTGGEFQATTGLIPTQETLSLWKSKKPTIYYGLGNAFKREGYRAYGFHNWTYTYYKRNITMGTLGFDNYIGCGNGLEKRMNCGWLPYDSTMVEQTVGDYLNQEGNFVTYYVSVSGHSPYNASDNIAKHHWDTVKDTSYSQSVKYYLAGQVELDKMLETLIAKLEEAGELDNTVIALVGDHYPYTLSVDEMNEMASYTKDGIIEINRSNFILWNSTMKEPIIVDKVGSQIDVLPTLLNLFGVEYDSRTIIGKDILSNYEGIAIFSNRSWVSDMGSYQSGSRRFTLREGKTLENESEEDYIKRMNNRVANSFSISKLIIDTDYYKYLLEG